MSEWILGRHAVTAVLRGRSRTVHEVVVRGDGPGVRIVADLASEAGIAVGTGRHVPPPSSLR